MFMMGIILSVRIVLKFAEHGPEKYAQWQSGLLLCADTTKTNPGVSILNRFTASA